MVSCCKRLQRLGDSCLTHCSQSCSALHSGTSQEKWAPSVCHLYAASSREMRNQ
jgi:hypothetical protein